MTADCFHEPPGVSKWNGEAEIWVSPEAADISEAQAGLLTSRTLSCAVLSHHVYDNLLAIRKRKLIKTLFII